MDDSESPRMSFAALREFEPFEWTGRNLIEQDNMGDWGAWIENFDGAIQDTLLDEDDDCESLAEMMAEEYINRCEITGVPMPADFNTTGDSGALRRMDNDAIKSEFVAYLRAWRKAIADGERRRHEA